MRLCSFVCGLWFVVLAASLSAGVYSPRVRHVGEPDRLSLSTWARDLGGADVTDSQFALRLLEELAHPQQGLQLVAQGPSEGPDKLYDFARVTDPVKLWHVYGYGDEQQIASVFAALWEASERGHARLVHFGKTPHWWVEVESDGRWWTFDVVRRSAFPIGEGQFASLTELQTQAALWQQPRGPLFYEQTEPAPLQELVKAGDWSYHAHAWSRGYTPEFTLPRGMRWTAFATPQGNRWALPATLLKQKETLAILEAAPAGPKSAAGTGPLHGNGQAIYEPNLQAGSGHFEDGAIISENVIPSEQGLTLASEGTGAAIFDLRVPGIIVPELGNLSDPKDDKDAAVIEMDASGTTLSYSLDNGVTWLSLETKTWPVRLDLTAQVAGTYGYLLRLELKGKPGEAVVRTMKCTTWTQISPRALPKVVPGQSRLEVRTGDEFGGATRSFTVNASTADENAFLAPSIRPPREYHPGDSRQRVLGPFTFRIAPPLGTQLTWFSYGGRVVVPEDNPEMSRLTLGYALGAPQKFALTTSPPVGSEQAGSDQHYDQVVRLEAPVSGAFGVMEGQPALNEFRLTTHGVDIKKREPTPWQVIHRWQEGSAEKENAFTVRAAGETYPLELGENVLNSAIEFRRD